MKDNSNANAGAMRRREDTESSHGSANGANGHFQANGHIRRQGVQLLSVMDLVLQRWHWLVLGSACGATLLYFLGLQLIKPKFTAIAELMRFEAPGKSEMFKTTPVSGDTFAAIIRAPELLRQVCDKALPPIAPDLFAKSIKIDPDPDSDIVKIQLAGRDAKRAIDLLNLYITNAVEYTRSLEARQAGVIANEYLKRQLEELDQDITYVEEQFRKSPTDFRMQHKLGAVGAEVNSVSTNLAASQATMISFSMQAQRLQAAQAELYNLLAKFTEENPSVRAKREEIKDLQRGITATSTNMNMAPLPSAGLAHQGPDAPNPEIEILQTKMRTLQDSRQDLVKREREAELYMSDPPGSVRVFAPANLSTIKTNHRRLKIGIATVLGAVLGFGGSLVLVLLVEFMDNRLKTADDVVRVTKLPVLTALGDLTEMEPSERSQWAFRTWTMLQGRLSPSANFGLVCGITSSAQGEGRSTWVSLLAEAASMTGFRVLTIATKPSSTPVGPNHQIAADASPEELLKPNEIHPSNALTTSVLSSPAQVTEKLTGPNSQPMVHIPLPGWVWNLERRKQWREALNQWRQIDNLVIFVELPPASVPEAVLLGSNLPNMLWLAESGKASASETQAQLETLRHARCNLVGAVLNKEPGMPLRKRLPRWLSCLAVLAVLGLSGHSLPAQDPASSGLAQPAPAESPDVNTPARTNLFFSVVGPSQRAEWQKHLTLGPGDVLNLSLYGSLEVARTEVAIGPDGRISYLEAQDVLATGLTIDELRGKLDDALGQYRRAPHTIVTPVAFKSKKYYMLGKVNTKGVYILDRPLTVLEALARAHGLENALIDRNLVSLTDYRRSFIARGGKRIPLDFQKLFEQGDLSQNIPVEPGDYIYFAPGDANEVYVVGEVRLPGPVAWTPNLTIIGAVAGRGGYTERAFRARVLVIRGPLNAPQAFPIDTHAILDAKGLNFKLQPHDIIYVNSRPFIKVEEAADLATTAFIQSVITSWVGVDVVKPVQ
ncbi:MAG TPA: polysaccharide biosynthesis/export family protein [Verrucomicrobiae bacterium]|nr:polysaccharide biosynthesis/export family protein [Verrucomicrobiae bacterium]